MEKLVPRFSSLRHLFRFLLSGSGLYDLLSFFPFSFKNNQSGQAEKGRTNKN